MTRTALVTGATGYIGSLLVTRLLGAGYAVRVLARGEASVRRRPWAGEVEVVIGDAADPDALRRACAGADVAYYLIHSMGSGADFEAADLAIARSFGAAARAGGVQRIIYLGGLHPEGELSAHMRSRVEVGEALMASGVPTACLQAAVILGDGSASFDMLRYLTSRLPVMVAPKWLRNRIQPIAVEDVLYYLVAAADLPPAVNRTFDIGGPDVLTYEAMMQRFARVTGLRERVIGIVPVLTPKLASYWVGLVSPVNPQVAQPLVGSLVHEVVCREHDLDDVVGPPPGGAIGFDEAVRAAMTTVPRDTGWQNLALTSALVSAAAVAGSLATTPQARWYEGLEKPAWQPPAAVFPVAWTTLYGLIAAAGAASLTELDRRGDASGRRTYLTALGTNLALNGAWSWVFFRARRLTPATVAAGVLAASSVDLVRRTRLVRPGFGAALAPYAAWTIFATALSGAVARRNPRSL